MAFRRSPFVATSAQWRSIGWHRLGATDGTLVIGAAAVVVLIYSFVDQTIFASARTDGQRTRARPSPVPEDGNDLLGRSDVIDALISTILFEQPVTIALTGAYGDGKTSLLNLTVGKLRKLEVEDIPIIARFSPGRPVTI